MSERITIKKLASEAGVSTATISRVFNSKDPEKVSPAVRKKVLALIKKYNYAPSIHAKGLASGKSGLIGLQIISINHPLSNINMIEGLENAAAAAGYSLILGVSNYDRERELNPLNTMLEKGVDGIIWQLADKPPRKILERICQKKYPLVWINHDYGYGIPYVRNDEFLSGRLAAEYLLKRGCKKPAFMGNFSDKHTSSRFAGWQEKLRESGCAHLLCIDLTNNNADKTLTYKDGYEGTLKLLQSNAKNLDGIFVAGSYIAQGAYMALQQKGISLEQLPLIGHDLIPIPPDFFPMPSICPQSEKIGSSAFQILKAIIDKKEALSLSLKPEIKESINPFCFSQVV